MKLVNGYNSRMYRTHTRGKLVTISFVSLHLDFIMLLSATATSTELPEDPRRRGPHCSRYVAGAPVGLAAEPPIKPLQSWGCGDVSRASARIARELPRTSLCYMDFTTTEYCKQLHYHIYNTALGIVSTVQANHICIHSAAILLTSRLRFTGLHAKHRFVLAWGIW